MNLLVLLFALLFLFMLAGVPIAFAMGMAAVCVIFVGQFPMLLVAVRTLDSVDQWLWLAIPLFVLMGNLLNRSGVTDRLIKFSDAAVGHIPGGLSHTNVVVSVLVAGMSSSSLADIAGVGKILIPNMKKEGYPGGYSSAVTSVSAIVGPIIPPSILFIILGTLGQISILRLWVGGIIPGLILAVVLIVIGAFWCRRKGYGHRAKFQFKRLAHTTYHALFALVVPVVIIGGMRAGVFTPTEAAAAGVVYISILGFFVYKGLNYHELLEASWDTAKTAGYILWFIAFGCLFGTVVHLCGATEQVAALVPILVQSKVAFLVLICLSLLILGSMMEIVAIILIFFPLALPIALQYGIDPVYFGVLFGLTVHTGLATPPIGVGMFIANAIAGVSIEEYVREGWPMLLAAIITIVIVATFPPVVLWLPNLIMG